MSSILLQVGALTTLLSLAIGPFTQQLLQLEQNLIYSPENERATIPRADRYSLGNEYSVATSWRSPNGRNSRPSTLVFADPDVSMQAAFNDGLNPNAQVNNIVQQLSFHCTTGNCTWDMYQSLAVCSICNDVSSEMVALESEGSIFNDLQNAWGEDAPPSNNTSFRLPNGLSIDNIPGAQFVGNKSAVNSSIPGVVLMTTYGTGNASETNTLQHINTLIWGMVRCIS